MSMQGIAGKRVLVTGGGRGIGAAITTAFVRHGARVLVNYHRHAEDAERLCADLQAAHGADVATPFRADIARPDEVDAMFEHAIRHLGGVDVLVDNAGLETVHPALDLSLDAWDTVMNVNLRGAFLCAQRAARQMLDQGTGGVIVNNSSIHESVPRLGLAHYCVSKAGLHMLTKALALEWAEHGIRVLGVSPGAIETEMNRGEIDAFGREHFDSWIPAGRVGQVGDVSEFTVFLASDAAAYCTGTHVTLDGGYRLALVRYDPREKLAGEK